MNIKLIVCFLITQVKSCEHTHIILSQENIHHLSNTEILDQVVAQDPAIIKKILNRAKKKLTTFPEAQDDIYVLTVHQQTLQEFIDQQLKQRLTCIKRSIPTSTASGKSLAITSCNHIFHKRCIKEQIYVNHKCPLCRTPLRRKRNAEDYAYLHLTSVHKENCAICMEEITY